MDIHNPDLCIKKKDNNANAKDCIIRIRNGNFMDDRLIIEAREKFLHHTLRYHAIQPCAVI